MTNSLNKFFDSLAQRNFCDVVFVFPKEDKKKITANKNVLVSACDEFKDMFLKDGKVVEWSEKDNGMDVVPVTDILYKCFDVLINNIYNIEMLNENRDPSKFTKIEWSDDDLLTVEEMNNFLIMAKKFKLPWLTKWSKYLIANQFRTSITINNCLPRLARSLKCNSRDLISELTNFIRNNRNKVLLLRKFDEINMETMKYMLPNCFVFYKNAPGRVDPIIIVNFVIAWAFEQCELESLSDSTANLKSFLEPLLRWIPVKLIPQDNFESNPYFKRLFSEEEKECFNDSKVIDIPASTYHYIRILFDKKVRLLSVSNVAKGQLSFEDPSDNRPWPMQMLQTYDSSKCLYICNSSEILEANHEYFVYIYKSGCNYTSFSCPTCSNITVVNLCSSCKSKAADQKCPCHEKIPLHKIDVQDSAKSVISNISRNSSNIIHQFEFVPV